MYTNRIQSYEVENNDFGEEVKIHPSNYECMALWS